MPFSSLYNSMCIQPVDKCSGKSLMQIVPSPPFGFAIFLRVNRVNMFMNYATFSLQLFIKNTAFE